MNAIDEGKAAAEKTGITIQNLQSGPKWRLYGLIAILILVLSYFLWLKFGTKPVQPGSVIQAQTAPAIAKMEQATVSMPKVVIVKDKINAVAKLRLPVSEGTITAEKLLPSIVIPPVKYGATASTFINTTTGLSRTVVKANEAPWFSFERTNTVGLEYGIGSKGKYAQGDFQRDVAQVKGVMLSGKVAAKYLQDKPQESEWNIGARLSWSWKSINW